MITRWIIGITLLFAILLLTLPDRDERSLSRIASASMLVCTKALRQEIAEQHLKGQAVTAEFKNTCPDLIRSVELDAQGGMLITGNKHPLSMALKPVLEQDKLRWSCRGEPEGWVTKLCKP